MINWFLVLLEINFHSLIRYLLNLIERQILWILEGNFESFHFYFIFTYLSFYILYKDLLDLLWEDPMDLLYKLNIVRVLIFIRSY